MKTKIHNSINLLFRLIIVSLVVLVYTCSPDLNVDSNENSNLDNKKPALKELVKGAAFKGANGIDIGPDGHIYVASVIGLEIAAMNRNNGKIIERFGQDMGVQGPDDLVFGPDGSLYWTDILLGEVGRMTSDGTVTKQFVAPGVNPIGFSDEGRLFVALDFLGDGLYELDPNLVEAPRPIIIATEANPFPLGFLNAFDFDAAGRLYGPLFAAGLVIRVDVGEPGDPPSTDPFGDGIAQVLAGGFRNPASAKFDPDGLLNVLDQTGEVFKVDPNTGEKTLFLMLEPGLDNQVYDSKGKLYISNNDHGWVAEILPSGQARMISPGGLIAPQGLAVLEGANNKDALIVADQYNLRQYNGTSGQQTNRYQSFLIPTVNPTSLITAQNVSADGSNLVVSSWFAGEVQVFDPQAELVIEQYIMAVPIDAIRFQNDIAVSDLGLGGVVRASDHSMILPIDNANVFAPGGLATDGDFLWVADWGTGIIWEISFDGNTQNTSVLATGLSFPEGLAYDNDGGLLVVETGTSQLSRIDLLTGEISLVVDGLELSGPGLAGFPPTWGFDGVAVGNSGDIYISGGGPNVIYRIKSK